MCVWLPRTTGKNVGEGVLWMKDRTKAYRLMDGALTKPQEELTLERAAEIAKELGVPVPPVRIAT